MIKDESIQRAFFVALLVLVTVAFLWLIRGFLQPVFWAVALSIVFYPAHKTIERKISNKPNIAASMSVLLVLLIVIIPVISILVAVTGEAAALLTLLRSGDINLVELFYSLTEYLPRAETTLQRLGIEPDSLNERLTSALSAVSAFVANWALRFGQDTLRVTLFFFLMLYLLFFFFRDGEKILSSVIKVLPLGDDRERALLARFGQVSRATIKGSLVIGITQGAIGGLAFAALNISAPVLWGVVMAFMSIVPVVGPVIIWFPAAIILLLADRFVAAIILMLIGGIIISLVDNLLRPILVGRDTQMPDYLIMLATLGGLAAFGLAGVVLGPVIAALFLSVWTMASEEFADIDQGNSGKSH